MAFENVEAKIEVNCYNYKFIENTEPSSLDKSVPSVFLQIT